MDRNPEDIFDIGGVTEAIATKQEYLEALRESTDGTFLEGMADELSEHANLDWMDVLVENESDITVDAVIGEEGIANQDLIEEPEIIKVLAKSDRANWNDPSKTAGISFLYIGSAIEEEFDSDTEFIEFAENSDSDMLFAGEIDLREEYSNLRNAEDSQEGASLLDLFAPNEHFDSLFAKNFITIGNLVMYSQSILDGWENEPEIGQYGVLEVSPSESHSDDPDIPVDSTDVTHYIVVKFVDSRETGISLNELLQEFGEDAMVPEEEDYLVESLNEYKIELLSYDTDILEYYPSHYIITEDDPESETFWLSATNEDELTVYDENPIPLDE